MNYIRLEFSETDGTSGNGSFHFAELNDPPSKGDYRVIAEEMLENLAWSFVEDRGAELLKSSGNDWRKMKDELNNWMKE